MITGIYLAAGQSKRMGRPKLLLVAFATGLTMHLIDQKTWIEVISGSVVGLLLFVILKHFTKGKKVEDIATVEEGEIEIKGSDLFVDGIFVSNLLGLELGQKLFKKDAIAAVITPTEPQFRLILEHFGQRQAMLFEATRALGLRRYSFSFQNFIDDRIVITFVPIENNFERLKRTILNTPLLESVKKAPELMDGKRGGEK